MYQKSMSVAAYLLFFCVHANCPGTDDQLTWVAPVSVQKTGLTRFKSAIGQIHC